MRSSVRVKGFSRKSVLPLRPGNAIGARGGAGLWRFSVVGVEPLGDAAALKLVHESERVHDTRVEVWLDPARGHLPLRAVLTPPEGGAPLELNLQREGSTGP